MGWIRRLGLSAVWLACLLVGCSADRIERGVYHSSKGYQVRLPGAGWSVEPGREADLALRRASPPGGMLADATCQGNPPRRGLSLLARHLVFGLRDRVTLASDSTLVDGRPAVRTVLRGLADGREVAVEAVVLKGERCVYDFLYVAPVEAFETGRAEFRAFVESFSGDVR